VPYCSGWATEIPPSDMRANRAVLDGYARPEGRASQRVNVTLTIRSP
jgi:hypothetical protein